ncbi:MAG: sigma-54-dependent Fis family transcriptional regulator [Candidatus Hydrogenedentes bacterium]|nr:sigma-54-dependent Fis family transcriptional regulator [Candidatus Hydrogenedentota bacterium]
MCGCRPPPLRSCRSVANQQRVLVVDDETSMREVLEIVLTNAGYSVTLAGDVDEAAAHLEREQFDAVMTDLFMLNDRQAGMRLLSWLQEHAATTPVIMMTAHGSIETAVEAMRRGAIDYIQKPFSNDEIRLRVKRAIEQRNLLRENQALRKEQARHGDIENMIGKSPATQEVLTMIRRVANLPSTVAIHGESGAGKELVARALHQLSDRAKKPFVAINCGGIPESLLESELFGHKKGAFTGAVEDKEGLFVVADGGTIFLDEIGEMPLMLQVKLLRVLDNSTVTPVGGTTAVKVNVRVLSATNRDLKKMSEDGGFRSDLYYRLNVIPIHVPPLRQRPDDIPLLTRHFIRTMTSKMGLKDLDISAEAMQTLSRYPWPGNVRELGNVIERAVALNTVDRLEVADLPQQLREAASQVKKPSPTLPSEGIDLEQQTADFEIALITQALERSRYSQKRAAELLGLSARSLRYRLQKYGLDEN